jgi:hypothetical protein
MFPDMVDERALEQELFTVGSRLAAAMPATRNPLKAFDEKAMDLAAQDAELKAALFRFVDVVPACRSLEDLARHLTGFLGEVDAPPPPVSAAMRVGNTRAGRAALGAAAAAGVRHMAHRFIVGEDPRAALGVLRDLWKDGVASSVDLLAEEEFRAGPSAGLVLQAYLRDSPATLDTVLDWLGRVERAQPLTVRLVKGAYWDHEIVEARQHGWQSPVFEVKAECDLNFEALTRRLLDARAAGSGLRVAVASHNLRSVSHAIAYHRLSGGDEADLELQVLRGLGDQLQAALAREGLRVRTYCPVGDLVAGMAYLVRRLLENTSNESFLHEQAQGAALEELLARPEGSTAARTAVS